MLKKGEKYACKDCGMEFEVLKGCECEDCSVTCCGEPVKKKK